MHCLSAHCFKQGFGKVLLYETLIATNNVKMQNSDLRRGKTTPSCFFSFQSHKSPEKSCITPNESRGDGTGKSKSGKRLDCGTHKFTSCTIASVRNLRCLDIFGRLRLKCSWYEWFERVPRSSRTNTNLCSASVIISGGP